MQKYNFNYIQADVFLAYPTMPELLANQHKLTTDDLKDLTEKYQIFQERAYTADKLTQYIIRNNHLYTFFAHAGRAQTFKQKCMKADTHATLLSYMNYQIGLFDGDVIAVPDKTKDKCDQPLDNTAKEDYYNTLVEIKNHLLTQSI